MSQTQKCTVAQADALVAFLSAAVEYDQRLTINGRQFLIWKAEHLVCEKHPGGEITHSREWFSVSARGEQFLIELEPRP